MVFFVKKKRFVPGNDQFSVRRLNIVLESGNYFFADHTRVVEVILFLLIMPLAFHFHVSTSSKRGSLQVRISGDPTTHVRDRNWMRNF